MGETSEGFPGLIRSAPRPKGGGGAGGEGGGGIISQSRAGILRGRCLINYSTIRSTSIVTASDHVTDRPRFGQE